MKPRATCLLALLLFACGAEEERTIDQTREVESTAGLSPMISTSDRMGLRPRAPSGHAPAAHAKPPGYAWDLPKGWKQLPPARFRDGNFGVGDERVDCYLSVLSGGGGGVAANLTRWRGQMGLAPMTKEEFSGLQGIPVLGRNGVLIEIDGSFTARGEPLEGYRMLGAIVEHDGKVVTVKMVGPADAVGAERDRFLSLVRSLRPAASERRAPSGDSTGFTWHAPEGWTEKKASRFRLVTFAPKDDDRTECYLAVLTGAIGDAKTSVNRWRGDMGEPVIDQAAFDALPEVEVLRRPSRFVEITGTYTDHMGGNTREGYMLLGIVCELERGSLFAKMIGPEKTVRRERGNFIRFVKSIH